MGNKKLYEICPHCKTTTKLFETKQELRFDAFRQDWVMTPAIKPSLPNTPCAMLQTFYDLRDKSTAKDGVAILAKILNTKIAQLEQINKKAGHPILGSEVIITYPN